MATTTSSHAGKPLMNTELSPSKQQRLIRYQQEYRQLKQKLAETGFVLQGSLTKRWMRCGKPSCGCQQDPKARHGPYYQWSWKNKGRTASVYLSQQQAELCQEWIANHRQMERVIQRMRNLSLCMSRLYGIGR
jgi:hypothetical protein